MASTEPDTAPDFEHLTVGALRQLIDAAALDDDALVFVHVEASDRRFAEDDGERIPSRASASKGFGEVDVLRIHL